MKKCPYCGKVHQDEDVRCTVDQTPLVHFEQQPSVASLPIHVEPFLRHTQFSRRDKWTYATLAFLLFGAGALSICGFKAAEELGTYAILYAVLYASANDHLTNFTLRNGKIVRK